jgi:hypothetical protein
VTGGLFTEMVADFNRKRISTEKEYSPVELLRQKAKILRENGFSILEGVEGTVYALDPTLDEFESIGKVMDGFERVPGLIVNLERWYVIHQDGTVVDLRKTFAQRRTMTRNPYVQQDLIKMRKEYGFE